MNNFNIDLVINQDGRIVTTSRIVAEKFGKRHDHVLRSIKNLDCSQEFAHLNFGECSYVNENNREMPEYTITRDGFSFLAMGFTGKKAAKFKEDYITAFNRMESAMVEPKQLSTVEILELALKTEKEKLRLESEVKRLEPKATMYDKVMDNGEMVDIGQIAKIFNVGLGRNQMFEYLREQRILFGKRNEPYQEYVNRGYFVLKFKTIERNNHPDFTVTKVLVTKKGMNFLASLLKVNQPTGNFQGIQAH